MNLEIAFIANPETSLSAHKMTTVKTAQLSVSHLWNLRGLALIMMVTIPHWLKGMRTLSGSSFSTTSASGGIWIGADGSWGAAKTLDLTPALRTQMVMCVVPLLASGGVLRMETILPT